jgi:hypothetical protein
MALMACTTPVLADDETEKIGIAAALGLTAADGKTTLGTGAGGIEAALLGSDAINQAGAIIVALTRPPMAGKKALLLTRNETINAAAYNATKTRIEAVKNYALKVKACATPPSTQDVKDMVEMLRQLGNGEGSSKGVNNRYLQTLGGQIITKSVADIVPALATSTSFANVPLVVEDRAMLSAILVNNNAELAQTTKAASPSAPALWKAADLTFTNRPACGTGTSSNRCFILPSEVQGINKDSSILNNYNAMLDAADRLRECTEQDNKAKAVVTLVDAYAATLNAVTDKSPTAPLALAIQQESLYNEDTPYALRISVEQTGGTGRTMSGIWYTLGFPGAAMVSSGIIVSFRLIHMAEGTTAATGIVRCAMAPASMRSVRRFAERSEIDPKTNQPKRKATCSYIAS